MNQAVLFNFAIAKEDAEKNVRAYQFIVMPGAPWAEVYEVLAEFVDEIKKLEVAELARAEAAKKEADVKAEEVAIEPEIVNPISE